MKPLSTVEDAKLVNSTWKYRSDESLNKILKIIEDGHPTVGLYVNDKLVSWAVTYPDGASGMLYTLENYRRKGYANIVMQQLFYYRSISNTNYGDPFDYIVVNNTKSENLFKKLNFKPIKKVDWVGYKMCKSKEKNNKWDNYFADESSGLLPWENGLPSSVLNNYLINNKKNHKITTTIRAIDVGCGSGFNTQLLGKYFSHVVGLDISISDKFRALESDKIINLIGKTNLVEVMEIISSSEGVISNDSGLMHVSASLDRKIIALYGSSSPTYTPPLISKEKIDIIYKNLDCSPCFKRV